MTNALERFPAEDAEFAEEEGDELGSHEDGSGKRKIVLESGNGSSDLEPPTRLHCQRSRTFLQHSPELKIDN